mmetsp:Transcript_1746/g.3590  ORF Transcript_1746/g.3590 Transcript_1746/m.3590 type:complete len:217 (+) Transcript_1746:300-950(+)
MPTRSTAQAPAACTLPATASPPPSTWPRSCSRRAPIQTSLSPPSVVRPCITALARGTRSSASCCSPTARKSPPLITTTTPAWTTQPRRAWQTQRPFCRPSWTRRASARASSCRPQSAQQGLRRAICTGTATSTPTAERSTTSTRRAESACGRASSRRAFSRAWRRPHPHSAPSQTRKPHPQPPRLAKRTSSDRPPSPASSSSSPHTTPRVFWRSTT